MVQSTWFPIGEMLRACPARRDNIISAGSAKPRCPCRRVGGSCYGGGRFEHLSTECLPFALDVDKWQDGWMFTKLHGNSTNGNVYVSAELQNNICPFLSYWWGSMHFTLFPECRVELTSVSVGESIFIFHVYKWGPWWKANKSLYNTTAKPKTTSAQRGKQK